MTWALTDDVGMGVDPIGESAERLALRETVRDVLRTHAPPERIRAHDEAETYDHELHRILGGLGLLAVGAPPELGGEGDVLDQVAIVEELAAGPTVVAAMLVGQYIATQVLHLSAVEEHRQALASVMRGESYVAFALSEADGGTDVARVMKTRARRVAGGFELSGEKMWTSAATYASHIIVVARTNDWERSPLEGITMFVVPRDAPGLSMTTIDTVGIRGLSTSVLSFAEVFVPEAHVLGAVDSGLRAVFPTLNRERLNSAAALVGVARGALELSCAYAKERFAFGRPIGGFQVLQHRLVDGALAIEEARATLVRAAVVEAAGGKAEFLAAMAKLSASRAAQMVTTDGMQLLGGAGFSRASPMQRWFRDARLWTFAPTSDEMLHNFLGERMIGLPRSF